ncbi:O-antigen ligase [Pontibacter sp. HSC-36F09]|uniref:O-antigen ligase family protein n=1 Tax=Pontibacter sp. HSC-36F09 TaxID=2910966 RepID=UPI00209E7EDE|nr:O-antigen ligase family protein [Pontibacter sp. HSC-36F09]MCP2044099.1 O-antigen ligase [Pontibacter sp. HSC-36F09]
MKALIQTSKKEKLIQRGYFFSLLLIAVSLFSPKQAPTNISIILFALVWLLEGNCKAKYQKLVANRVAVSFIALFALYLVGVLYTEDFGVGIKSLETRSSLLVFPLLIGSATIRQDYLHKSLLTFAYTCAVLSLVALVYQTFVVLEKNDFNYFFSDGLVSIMGKQAAYYAIYVAFSILILVHNLWEQFSGIGWRRKILSVVVILFLLFFLFLLASRTSLGILLLILFASLVGVGVRYGRLKYTLAMVAALLAFIVGLSIVFPQTVSRFKSLRNISYDFSNTADIYHFSGEDSEAKWNGLNLRLAKWVCAVDVIRQNPFGVGTGDVKDELVEAYRNRNFTYAAENRFDPHNQFLDTAVAIGIPGLAVLLCCYLLPLFIALKNRSWLLGCFVILIIACSITESVLSSAQGVIFFCFFLFILLKATAFNRSTNGTVYNVPR